MTCNGEPGEPGYIITSEPCSNCGNENDMECPGCSRCHPSDCTVCEPFKDATSEFSDVPLNQRHAYHGPDCDRCHPSDCTVCIRRKADPRLRSIKPLLEVALNDDHAYHGPDCENCDDGDVLFDAEPCTTYKRATT